MEVKASAFIKDKNRKLLLEEIIKNQSISRSELSKLTKLNKVTTSSQVKSLIDEGLISETKVNPEKTGRKPLKLALIGDAGYSLGIDIDNDYIQFLLTDLNGVPHESKTVEITDTSFEAVMDVCVSHILAYQKLPYVTDSPYGLVATVFGVHGIVANDETVVFTPQHQWSDVSIHAHIKDRINVHVIAENSTNLCAYAEYSFLKDVDNLISISTYSGIGLGLVNNSEIFKGFHGFAGEVGHMIIERDGLPCSCGNRGCWELYASEKALMKRISHVKGETLTTLEELEALFKESDQELVSILHEHLDHLAIGLNNILNIYNPESIIINSGLITILSELETELKQRLHSRMNNFDHFRISSVGKSACVIGACALGIREFLKIDNLFIDSKVYE